jgi:alpha-amylase
MVTGGYYEPILPMIPDGDKIGQIRKMTRFIEESFGQTPAGLWLSERVWEPGLPAPLVAAGVRWTLVDDAHFRMTGLSEDDLDGYYLTEDQGARIMLFSGSQRLRYTIPWLNVEDLIAELRQRAHEASKPGPYMVLGDDGEKFGGWPTTYAHVWEKGWMERFFAALEAEAEWLETITPAAYAERFEARGLVYLPAASYAEMMEWAMPAHASSELHQLSETLDREGRGDVLKYVRGGFWRSFLAKYPEANDMHKRGLRIDAKLEHVEDALARDALWRAQCNCPYWHGVFGGLYLRHIRTATLANLVRAERLADEAAGVQGVTVSEEDYDYDGARETLIQTSSLSLLLHPETGGMLSQLDLRSRDWPMLGVLTRYREAYHEALLAGSAVDAQHDQPTNIHGSVRVKQQGLGEALILDRFRRSGLQEWIVDDAVTVDAFSRGQTEASFEPAGEWESSVSCGDGGASVRLSREHSGWRVVKQIDVPACGEEVHVAYECTNATDEPRRAQFISEWNLSPPQAPAGDDRIAKIEFSDASVALTSPSAAVEGVVSFTVRGSATYGLQAQTSEPATLWHFPVESVSSSEGGLERVWQGGSVSVVRRLDLAPGETMRFSIDWRVVDVEPVALED